MKVVCLIGAFFAFSLSYGADDGADLGPPAFEAYHVSFFQVEGIEHIRFAHGPEPLSLTNPLHTTTLAAFNANYEYAHLHCVLPQAHEGHGGFPPLMGALAED